MIDAHCHFSFLKNQIDSVLSEQKKLGIKKWLIGGYDLEDWKIQLDLQNKYPGEIIPSLGIHPWLVESEKSFDLEFKFLKQHKSEFFLMGEMGLDFHRAKSQSLRDCQVHILKRQLELAEQWQKPLVLHIVSAHDAALNILADYDLPGGFVHAFTASSEIAQDYIKQGFLISVGASVLNPNSKKLRKALLDIPLESLVFESDRPGSTDEQGLQNPKILLEVLQAVADIKRVEPQLLIQSSSENIEKLLNND